MLCLYIWRIYFLLLMILLKKGGIYKKRHQCWGKRYNLYWGKIMKKIKLVIFAITLTFFFFACGKGKEINEDQEVLDEAILGLNIIEETDTVTTSFIIADDIGEDIFITWESSNETYAEIVTTNAINTVIISRPDFGEGNITVTLIATVCYEELTATKSFDLIILENEEEEMLTDEEKVVLDKELISNSNIIKESTTISLSTTGLNGSSISWSFLDSEGLNNSCINLETGQITILENKQVVVWVEARITLNDVSDTKEIMLLIGEYQLINIENAYEKNDNDIIRIKGILTHKISTNTYCIEDETAAFNIYVPTELLSVFSAYDLGIELDISGVLDINDGLYRITQFKDYNVVIINTNILDINVTDISSLDFTNEELVKHMSKIVRINDFILKEEVTIFEGSFYYYLINPLDQREIGCFVSLDQENYEIILANIKTFKAGDSINIDGGIMSFFNKPEIVITNIVTSQGTTLYTEMQLANCAKANLDNPEENQEITENIILPTNGLFNSTIVWSSNNIEFINNEGIINKPEQGETDKTVILTYTLTMNEISYNEEIISVIVKANEAQKDLFISEYCEGSNNNKYIEIYNATGNAIDLSNYKINTYSNGGSIATFTCLLSGMLQNNETYVVYNGGACLTIINAGDRESNITLFNGGDAVCLLKKNSSLEFTIIDIIGDLLGDPGDYWIVGTGTTKDYTLIRKAEIDKPSLDFIQNEWLVYSIDTFTDIGEHTIDYHIII